MTFYNWLLHSLLLPVGDQLFGGNYLKYIKQWQDFDKKSGVELEAIQKEKLQNILQYAKNNVPFYKNIEASVSLINKLVEESVDLMQFTEKSLNGSGEKLISIYLKFIDYLRVDDEVFVDIKTSVKNVIKE